MEGSSEDRCRSRLLADLYGSDEPEEGELVVPGPGYHSDADTEEYYNNHRDCSSDSDETISDSVPAANYGGASTSSSAPANNNNNNGGGGASSAAANNCASASTSSAAANNNKGGGGGAACSSAAPVLACPFCGKEFRNHKAVCGHMKVHREQQGVGKGKGIKMGRLRQRPQRPPRCRPRRLRAVLVSISVSESWPPTPPTSVGHGAQ
ncbi:hypothetical protein BAE44_0002119 [Dichanthelium oligosanthes]|uniref:C2H2-type domain-containing protein n=1 Tax=Dichanthelium oligosanthes TaxID=888268 RepID=A0A1E5WHJ1_9POAL|nr:hypothetical protein BAE44_0002119 [Dichanthelium oligosanthes]